MKFPSFFKKGKTVEDAVLRLGDLPVRLVHRKVYAFGYGVNRVAQIIENVRRGGSMNANITLQNMIDEVRAAGGDPKNTVVGVDFGDRRGGYSISLNFITPETPEERKTRLSRVITAVSQEFNERGAVVIRKE